MSEEWSFEKDDFLTTTPYEALYAYFEQLLNMYLCLLRIQNSKPFRICKRLIALILRFQFSVD